MSVVGGDPERPEVFGPGDARSHSNSSDPSDFSFSIEAWQLQTPMLPPAMMREYEQMVPGFADRFVSNWERQTAHRQYLERNVIATQSTTQLRGQRYALALGIVGLLVAGASGVTGHEATAIAVTGLDFASLGGAFIYSKRKDDQQLKDKAQEVPEAPRPQRNPAELPKGRVTPPRPKDKRKKR